MILTAYLDESGTHGGSPSIVMAGVMGNAAQWGRFQSEVNHLKRKYGFTVFHSTDFKHRKGAFKGWSPEKCWALLDDLGAATSDKLMDAVTVTLDNSLFDKQYRGTPTPKKVRLDTQYGLCFRMCLTYLMSDAIRRLGHHAKFADTRLHVVLESGHRHRNDALRVFDDVKADIGAPANRLLASATLANKSNCDPLLVADFLSHTTYVRDLKLRGGAPPRSKAIAKAAHGIMHMEFTPDGLASLKEDMAKRLKAKWHFVSSPSQALVPGVAE